VQVEAVTCPFRPAARPALDGPPGELAWFAGARDVAKKEAEAEAARGGAAATQRPL